MTHVNFLLEAVDHALDSYLHFKLDSDVSSFAELLDPSIEITVWSVPASNRTIMSVSQVKLCLASTKRDEMSQLHI